MEIHIKKGCINKAKYINKRLFVVKDNKTIEVYNQNSKVFKTFHFNSTVVDFMFVDNVLNVLIKKSPNSYALIKTNIGSEKVFTNPSVDIKGEVSKAVLANTNCLLFISPKNVFLFNLKNQEISTVLSLDSIVILSNIGYYDDRQNILCVIGELKLNKIHLIDASYNKIKSIPIDHLLGETFSIYSEVFFANKLLMIFNPVLKQSDNGDLECRITGTELRVVDLMTMTLKKTINLKKALKIIGIDDNYFITNDNNDVTVVKIN